MSIRDYGRSGLFGIGTPQANATVEAEIRILLPSDAALVVTRLTSPSPDSATRLRSYLTEIERHLSQYDTLRPDAFGFCCTASSYLVPAEEEEKILADAEARFGFPVISASAAIAWHLARTGVRRLALASPYPKWLSQAALNFWQAKGFEVVRLERIGSGSDNTQSIYELGSEDGRSVAVALARLDVDAVLLSGTGMPSLRLIGEANENPPLLSSNYCMAMRLCAAIGIPEPDAGAWRARLSLASPNSEEGFRE